MRPKLIAIALMVAFTFNTVLAFAREVQEPGFQATEPIRKNQEFAVTFHRPNLKGGQVTWINGADIVDSGPALAPEEIDKGFKVGDLIAIRIKAPVECFVYGVNNSQWDGATLVENGEKLQVGVARDFVYRLTNRQGRQEPGHENILFLIRRQQISPEEVKKFLLPATNQAKPEPSTAPEIKLGGTPIDQQKAQASLQADVKTKADKAGPIVKVGCVVASIFFPFVGRICAATAKAAGFSAADPVRRGQVQPTQDAENMVIQFSFPVGA
jgi:hypothetical protein